MAKSVQDFNVRGSGGDVSEYLPQQNAQRIQQLLNSKIILTDEGGIAVRLTNKTGVPSVKGTIVETASGTDNAFDIADADAIDGIGVVYEDGIADGSECFIVIYGRCQVLLKDATASTAHNWAGVSDVAGRADMTNASPPAAPAHFAEIGHCIETKGADTDVLAFCMVHFN